MTAEVKQHQRQVELKDQLATGEYKTLIDVILDGTGNFIKRFTRGPKPASWYSAAVIALITLLISFLISLLLGEFYLYHRDGGIINFLLQIWLVGIIFLSTMVIKKYCETFFKTLGEKFFDAIESATDLVDFQNWLVELQNLRKPLFFSLTFGVLAGFYIIIYYAALGAGFPGFGPTILGVIVYFQAGILFYYYFILFLPFPIRLSRYHFKLNPVNPSSSQIIDHLSDILNYFVYIYAVLLAIGTFWLVIARVFDFPNIILLVIVGWGPLTVLFFINQFAISRIIKQGKWKKLNEIQAKIEILEGQEEIPGEQTLARLTKLMDYYDRIKGTPNSALDLRTGLNFVNSLLLPILSFAIANFLK